MPPRRRSLWGTRAACALALALLLAAACLLDAQRLLALTAARWGLAGRPVAPGAASRSAGLARPHRVRAKADGAIKEALADLRLSLLGVTDDLEDQWGPLLGRVEGRMSDSVMLIENGMERAEIKMDIVAKTSSQSYAFPIFELVIVISLIATVLVVMFLAVISMQLTNQRMADESRQRTYNLAKRTVIRALGITEESKVESGVRDAILETVQGMVPALPVYRSYDGLPGPGVGPVPVRTSVQVLEEMVDEEERRSAVVMGAVEALDVRIRQRARNAVPMVGEGNTVTLPAAAEAELRSVLQMSSSSDSELPDRAKAAQRLLLETFSLEEERKSLSIALYAAAVAMPSARWRFKETVVMKLVEMGADACTVTALLLHDLDDCLGHPWRVVAEAILACPDLSEEVVTLIGEKKRLEQLGVLQYLRALAEDRMDATRAMVEMPAACQLMRLLYLNCSRDFRGALVEIAEVEQMLRDLSTKALREYEVPEEARALARVVLDLHAPLAHGLGLDALSPRVDSVGNDRLTPSLEQLALRLHFPDEYRMIESWMLQEDELLSRTLRRSLMEVRAALSGDPDFNALATFKVNGRVKSVYSLVKKLLRQRGPQGQMVDLKAEAVKDLLALEVIITPDPAAEVPHNPEWLAQEWRERAACFAALDALQRYAQQTTGWWVLEKSTKDYITKSKKSGYRALHITLGTNVQALLPRASSLAMRRARGGDTTMPCKLEVHIFSDLMKKKEKVGAASHNLYKAFELTTEEVFAGFSRGSADPVGPIDLRKAIFPAEKLRLGGEVFSPLYVNTELEQLLPVTDTNFDGRLSFGEVQRAHQDVARKLEDFRRALEQRQQHWWVHGVHASDASPPRTAVLNWGTHFGSLSTRQKEGMLNHALEVTKASHRGQLRKSGDPYWTHPLAVADILARLLLPLGSKADRRYAVRPVLTVRPEAEAQTPEELERQARSLWRRIAVGAEDVYCMYIAALLHDTVEDTAMTIREIQSIFGPVVAGLVDGVTKASCSTRSRVQRSARDLRKVLTHAASDVRVLVIKFADRLHNMRTLEHMPGDKQRRIAEETRAVFVPLAERLGIHVWKTELETLCSRYLNGYAYELVVDRNEERIVGRTRNLRYIQQYFSTLIVDWMVDGSIQRIEMDEEPIHTQLRKWALRPGGSPPTPVPRVMVVTKDRETCWTVLGRIHSLLPPMPERLRDYISTPKENLYMCLHTTVLMDGAPIQVFIKSFEMDWVSEYGVGAYWRHNAELQLSNIGRMLQDALLSTWLHEANDSLEQSLRDAGVPAFQERLPGGDLLAPSEESSVDSGASNGTGDPSEQEDLQDLGPLLKRVVRVASGGAEGGADEAAEEGAGAGLGSVHRAYREVLREKVTVLTPTGRVVYLPRDATALDFAVWNLGERKGLRAESVMVDGVPAPLFTRLKEGQTVLVHLRDSFGLRGEDTALVPPPREWAGVHLRYLRTARGRAALVKLRSTLVSNEEAIRQGVEALGDELRLQCLDLGLLQRLDPEVLTAAGRGALPVELVSAQVLATQLGIPLGDPFHEYYKSRGDQDSDAAVESSEHCHVLSFLLVAEDRPGLLSQVVAVVRKHGLDFRRLHAEPRESGRCIIIASVATDCTLRFGSLLHFMRESTSPTLIERIPTEHGAPSRADAATSEELGSEPEIPSWSRGGMETLKSIKLEALQLASEVPSKRASGAAETAEVTSDSTALA